MSKIRKAIFLVGCTLATLSLEVQAIQILPDPNPAGNTITINSIFFPGENFLVFENYGGIDISSPPSALINYAILNNNGGATLSNSGGLNNISGAILNNRGMLNNNVGATLSNNGSLNNNGGAILNNRGMLNNNAGATLINSGSLNNTGGINIVGGSNLVNIGILTNNYGANLSSQIGSRLDNYGILDNYASSINGGGGLGLLGVVNNSGTLNNHSGATMLSAVSFVNNLAGASLNNDGDLGVGFSILTGGLNNYGTLNNNSHIFINNVGSSISDLENYGLLNNIGSLDAYGYLGNNGHLVSNGTLTIHNNGAMVNNGQLDNHAQLTNDGGLLRNLINLNNSGTLGNNGNLENNGTLNNSGTLNNNADLFNKAAILNNSGTLNNAAGATLVNYGAINGNSVLYNTGILNNNAGATLQNDGTLRNDTGTVNNAGAITGTGTYIQTVGRTINNGTLTQALIQIDGGSLSGTGTINGNVNIGSAGSVNPGNSPGTLTINGDFASSGNLVFELAGLGSGQYDVLNINGNLFFTGGLITFNFINGFQAAAGDSWDFLFANSITGLGTLGFAFNGLGDGLGWEFTESNGHLNLSLTRLGVSVPEPQTYALIALGLVLLGVMARRKQQFVA